jgi:replication initiation protein RepC
MQISSATTPFGRRDFTLAQMKAQLTAKEREPGKSVEKWKIFDAIKNAKDLLGISDRALMVLNALLSFHPLDTLSGDDPIVVFPSNKSLALRAHGMSETTLRTYLRSLVALCFILRNDSPNGKRYARRGQGGKIEAVYGFDLSPILARAEEFIRLAAEAKEQEKAIRRLRERVTICRRDIDKMISTGSSENIPADWEAFRVAYKELNRRLPRKVSLAVLEPLVDEHERQATTIFGILEEHIKQNNLLANKIDGNDIEISRHIQNSNSDQIFESETSLPIGEKTTIEPSIPNVPPSTPQEPPKRGQQSFPLSMILEACPDIVYYAKGTLTSWNDLITTASFVRPLLGISPSAWEDAIEVLGPKDAAIIVAAINQRSTAITSAGGYLRVLTQKARAGCFSIGPVLVALIRANLGKRIKIDT